MKLYFAPVYSFYVIYWPSTEPSIKRCTCVNKPKKSGSRWTLRKNKDRVSAAVSQSETGMPKWESACRGLGSEWPTVEQLQPRYERSAAMVKRRTLINIAVCPCLHSSLTHNRTSPFRKSSVRDLYFCKEVYSFVHWSRHYCWLCFPLIYAIYLDMYTCSCTVGYTTFILKISIWHPVLPGLKLRSSEALSVRIKRSSAEG